MESLVALPSSATPRELQRGEGFLCQVKLVAVNFAVGSVAEAPGFCAVNFADTPRTVVVCRAWQAQWSLATGANSAEDPGFCVGNFAADLNRKISHTKLTGPESPPHPPYTGLHCLKGTSKGSGKERCCKWVCEGDQGGACEPGGTPRRLPLPLPPQKHSGPHPINTRATVMTPCTSWRNGLASRFVSLGFGNST